MLKKFHYNQTLFDFALQHTGDIAGVFSIAKLNDIDLSEIQPMPQNLKVEINTEFLPKYYSNRNINIVTGRANADQNCILAEDGSYLLAEDGTKLLYE